MGIQAIALIVLRADDPDRLADFYRLLGLDFSVEQHGTGPRHLAAALGLSVLEIYPRQPGGPETRGTRLGFTVTHLSDILARLGGAECILSQGRQEDGSLHCVLRDPEGHVVELRETLPFTPGR